MRPVPLLGWLLLIGCSTKEEWSKPPVVVVPESLVVSIAAPNSSTPVWSLDLRSAKPAAPYERDLNDHAVGEMLLDGGIVVARAAGTWFRQIYDSSGQLVAQFRQGGGPGELVDEGRIFNSSGDTLVFLHRDGSVNVAAAPKFTLQKWLKEGAPIQSQFWLGPHLADGRWLGIELRNVPGSDSLWNDYDLRWLLLGSGFNVERLISRFPWREQDPQTETRTWSWETVAAMAGSSLLVSFNAEPVIDVYDTTGSIIRRIRIDLPKRPATRKEVTRYQRLAREAFLETSPKPDEIQAYDRSMRHFRHAPHFPYFGPMKVSTDGFVWVPRYNPRPESDTTRFLILDPLFRLVATATLPEGYTLVQVHRDHALIWSIAGEHSLIVPVGSSFR